MGPRVSTSILADRLTGMIGPRASVARGVLDQHGQSEFALSQFAAGHRRLP